ncbi:unnamed protein product [Lactuca saligna]|uniref:Uncharacterized protein n=1 Tax=Lactuca saligna TaxID=75948 RepID=A0AA36EP72_LACSI|nr:unnamed protein product [Lactuca saligna]
MDLNVESSISTTQLNTNIVVAKVEYYYLRFSIKNIDDIPDYNKPHPRTPLPLPLSKPTEHHVIIAAAARDASQTPFGSPSPTQLHQRQKTSSPAASLLPSRPRSPPPRCFDLVKLWMPPPIASRATNLRDPF